MGKFRMFLILLLLFVISLSCTGLPLSEKSEEFKDGYRTGQAYSKRDAMDLGCYFLRQNATAHTELQKHKAEFIKEGHAEEFISGFCMGYKSHFKEYVDIYCDRRNN